MNRLRFVKRSEAISSFKARLLRYARKDEVHGLCAVLLSKTDNSGRTVLYLYSDKKLGNDETPSSYGPINPKSRTAKEFKFGKMVSSAKLSVTPIHLAKVAAI